VYDCVIVVLCHCIIVLIAGLKELATHQAYIGVFGHVSRPDVFAVDIILVVVVMLHMNVGLVVDQCAR
jgi:hypothetical protein